MGMSFSCAIRASAFKDSPRYFSLGKISIRYYCSNLWHISYLSTFSPNSSKFFTRSACRCRSFNLSRESMRLICFDSLVLTLPKRLVGTAVLGVFPVFLLIFTTEDTRRAFITLCGEINTKRNELLSIIRRIILFIVPVIPFFL